MKKNLVSKLIILGVILIGFISYITYTKWSDSHFKIASNAFLVEKDYQSLIDDQKKINPFVELAYQFNLPKTVNRTITLPNLKRKITIHKMWYAGPFLYVLYSVNLHKTDKSPDDVPVLKFSNIVFHTTKHNITSGISTINVPSNNPYFSNAEVYNNELYRSILLTPTNFGNYRNPFSLMQSLKNIELHAATLKVPKKGEIKLDQLQTLHYSYQTSDNTLFQEKLHHTIHLNAGVQLTFTKWQATVYDNLLYFTTNDPSHLPDFMYISSRESGKAGSDDLHSVPLIKKQNENVYAISLYPIQPNTTKINLSFLKSESFGNGVKLDIPSSAKPGDKIGRAYGGNFYYGGIKKISNLEDQLTIKWDNPTWKNASPANHLGSFDVINKQDFEAFNSGRQRTWNGFKITNQLSVFTIQNEKGEHPRVVQSMGENVDQQYGTFSVMLDHAFVQHAKDLIVNLDRLPVTQDLAKQTITLNIPNKGHRGN